MATTSIYQPMLSDMPATFFVLRTAEGADAAAKQAVQEKLSAMRHQAATLTPTGKVNIPAVRDYALALELFFTRTGSTGWETMTTDALAHECGSARRAYASLAADYAAAMYVLVVAYLHACDDNTAAAAALRLQHDKIVSADVRRIAGLIPDGAFYARLAAACADPLAIDTFLEPLGAPDALSDLLRARAARARVQHAEAWLRTEASVRAGAPSPYMVGGDATDHDAVAKLAVRAHTVMAALAQDVMRAGMPVEQARTWDERRKQEAIEFMDAIDVNLVRATAPACGSVVDVPGTLAAYREAGLILPRRAEAEISAGIQAVHAAWLQRQKSLTLPNAALRPAPSAGAAEAAATPPMSSRDWCQLLVRYAVAIAANAPAGRPQEHGQRLSFVDLAQVEQWVRDEVAAAQPTSRPLVGRVIDMLRPQPAVVQTIMTPTEWKALAGGPMPPHLRWPSTADEWRVWPSTLPIQRRSRELAGILRKKTVVEWIALGLTGDIVSKAWGIRRSELTGGEYLTSADLIQLWKMR